LIGYCSSRPPPRARSNINWRLTIATWNFLSFFFFFTPQDFSSSPLFSCEDFGQVTFHSALFPFLGGFSILVFHVAFYDLSLGRFFLNATLGSFTDLLGPGVLFPPCLRSLQFPTLSPFPPYTGTDPPRVLRLFLKGPFSFITAGRSSVSHQGWGGLSFQRVKFTASLQFPPQDAPLPREGNVPPIYVTSSARVRLLSFLADTHRNALPLLSPFESPP